MFASSIERACGNRFCSMPITKTASNSRPFALCSVISVTRPEPSRLRGQRIGVGDQRDLLQEARERRLLRARARTRARRRRAPGRFSMRPDASIVRSASSSSITPVRSSSALEQVADAAARRRGRAARPSARGTPRTERAGGGARGRRSSDRSSASQSERPRSRRWPTRRSTLGVADAAARLVDDAPQRDLVGSGCRARCRYAIASLISARS